MAVRRNFDMSFSEDSLRNLFSLSKAMDHYPNRIEHALQTAVAKTESEAHRKLAQNYGNSMLGKDNVINIENKATLRKATLRVEILEARPKRKSKSQSALTKGRFDANIKMYGRKRYTSTRSSGEGPYDLEDFGKPVDFAYRITVPAKSPNQSFVRFIKYGIRSILVKNLRESIAKQGIGSRGGISRITGGDIPRR